VTDERTESPMNPVAEMLLNEPAPAAIWATLMLLCLPALILLSSPHGLRHPRLTLLQTLGAVRRPGERGERRRRVRAEALETIRYADEMRVASNQAGLAAQRWQERHEQAEEQAVAAWLTWQEADSELTRLRAAAAFTNPWTAPTPAEYADRERYLHRTVHAASARGDLPAGALAEEGWDTRLHPFDQDVAVARATVAHRRECHRRAAETAVAAAHDANLAIRSRDSLRLECVAAALRAAQAHHLAPATRPAPVATRRAVRTQAA
jgi:hypothetical protein